ncbi:MAG TPA: tetratricopeptide repeat protein [Sphingomicrobium sp.]|nr:tetratricopeptide repeat protein [Sphingomicrobium sp.]
MRGINVLLGGAAIFVASSASAADTLKFGPPPAWVTPQPIPQAKPTDAPVNVLLSNAQITMEPGKIATYGEIVFKIQNPQGLAAGNLSLSWQPATDTVTVNKLQIRRGDKIIDVLASGQTFTVLRRETNLEAAMFDGTLTANIQPEGLQEGDIVEFASTTEHSDPVLKGHVEALFGSWNESPIESAYTKLTWPAELKLNVRKSSSLPEPKKSSRDGKSVFELSALHIEPISPPKGAPSRFKVGRLVEATDYSSWADLADLMAPLFRAAAVIPAAGPLHDEVEQIRTSSSDPKRRAELALALAQDRVRYVALLMGQGGYVPATAETTWSRRFGDCKAKTALLVAILHALQIEAEPVLVQSTIGDMIEDRLPALELFDHVLVRAHIGGKDYWLDGTRTGDINLDGIQVPDFGWGLPLVSNARLVQIVPPALTAPNVEHRVEIDASSGVLSAIPITIEEIYRGDSAVAFNTLYSRFTAAQRDEFAHDIAKKYYDGFATASTSFQFDKAKRAFDVTIKGTAKLNWDDGWLSVPTSSIAFDPDFDRPSGSGHDAPFAVSHPRFVNDRATILLPVDFAAQQKLSPRIQETLAGVEYARTESIDGNKLTVTSSERSVVAEVPYKDALAAEPRLRALNKDDIYLRLPTSYRASEADLNALRATKPASAMEYSVRAHALLAHGKVEDGLSDLNAALAIDPKNVWALARRASVYIGKQQFTEAEKDLREAATIEPGSPEVLATRSELAISKGDFTAATNTLDNAIERDPTNNVLRLQRAIILVQQGKDDDALREIEKVIASSPHNVEALGQHAWILASKEDWAGAERDLAAAFAVDPGNATVLATKAMIAIQRKDFKSALDLSAQALAKDPGNSFARNLQAKLLKRGGDENQAMRGFDDAVARAPKNASPLLDRAFARLEAKQFDGAEQDVAAALAIEPTNLRALQARAQISSTRNDYGAAVAALTQALSTGGPNGRILAQRAEAFRQLKNYEKALADTQTALDIGYVSPALRLLRINILLQQGSLADVAAECDRLVKENPSSDFAMVVAGKTYMAIGLRQKAMDSFDRALVLKQYAYIYINRAQARPYSDMQGKFADLDAALKAEPEHEDALAEKARLLSRQGKHAEAIDLYDRAIKAALDGSYLELGRAIALERAGRSAEAKKAFDAERAKAKTVSDFKRLCWTKAINDVALQSALEDCRKALRIDADSPSANESLGLVLLKLGKLKESLAAFDLAVAKKAGADAYMGRAIVRSKLGDAGGAHGDAGEAFKLRPDIDDTFAEYGLKFDPAASSHSAAAH